MKTYLIEFIVDGTTMGDLDKQWELKYRLVHADNFNDAQKIISTNFPDAERIQDVTEQFTIK